MANSLSASNGRLGGPGDRRPRWCVKPCDATCPPRFRSRTMRSGGWSARFRSTQSGPQRSTTSSTATHDVQRRPTLVRRGWFPSGVAVTGYVATIRVRPKAEVRDPQGEAIGGALRSLGMEIADVRTGKVIVVRFSASSSGDAQVTATRMGDELLANPV